jgi:hypothetical protein
MMAWRDDETYEQAVTRCGCEERAEREAELRRIRERFETAALAEKLACAAPFALIGAFCLVRLCQWVFA